MRMGFHGREGFRVETGFGWGQDPWWGCDSRWGRGSGRGWGSGSRASCSGKPRQYPPHHSEVSVFGDIRGHPSAHGELLT